jgi:tetratricopeptide (TPR) repeat protein/tRNA A-37 threonylcarbamoyl transferase component Bud32
MPATNCAANDAPSSSAATLFWRPGPPRIRRTIGDSDFGIDEAVEAELGIPAANWPRLRQGQPIPGTRLRVDGWLGEGASSVVYRGRHVDLERPLAIKVLRVANPTPAVREQFLTEARTTSAIASEHVVDVVDFGALPDGRLYYAMALVPGRPLADVLDRGPIGVARAVALLRMACKGLAAAHEVGVVHRDVKPANLMLLRRRGRERLVLVDFGIATASGSSADTVCGTPHYMAPEQIEGSIVDARTDIYALGCCAYEMLTGNSWVSGENVHEVLDAHLTCRGGPATFPAHVPPELRRVVLRCLERDPDARYPDAVELEAALCEVQIAAQLPATDHLEPPSVEEDRRRELSDGLRQPQRRQRRHRLVLTSVVAVALALFGTGWMKQRTEAMTTDEERVEQELWELREAADEARFVVSPSDDPTDTALHRLTTLENWEGPAEDIAHAHARRLRGELGEQLIALADARWDDPNTRGYARDYYAHALVFDPTAARARERVGMTFGEIAELRHKALTQSFSPEEARAAVVLAEAPEAAPMPSKPAAAPRHTHHARPASKPVPEEPIAVVAPAPAPTPTPAPATDTVPQGSDPNESRRWVRTGRRALRQGAHGEAFAAFERAVRSDPDNARAYAGLADVSFERGDHQRALQYARLAVARAPQDADHRVRLGDAYVAVDRRADALRHYEVAARNGSVRGRARLDELGSK